MRDGPHVLRTESLSRPSARPPERKAEEKRKGYDVVIVAPFLPHHIFPRLLLPHARRTYYVDSGPFFRLHRSAGQLDPSFVAFPQRRRHADRLTSIQRGIGRRVREHPAERADLPDLLRRQQQPFPVGNMRGPTGDVMNIRDSAAAGAIGRRLHVQ